jgi:methionyl-tRNA formyltransferase
LCHEAGIEVLEREGAHNIIASDETVFSIGWQFLIPGNPPNLIVLHDSLLPRFRGFAPSVAALIKGETEHGVTALRADSEMDCGPVASQVRLRIEYPMKIGDLFRKLGPLYTECVAQVLALPNDKLNALPPQCADGVSYSIWRDKDDFRVNWLQDSNNIERFINALGYPYGGATAILNDLQMSIHCCSVIPDVNFEERHPGKIWRLHADGAIDVVCGSGMVQVSDLRDDQGYKITPKHLRSRFT